jgi:hypothetical protein
MDNSHIIPVTLAEVTYASGSPSKGVSRFRRNNRSSISNEVSDEAVKNHSIDGLTEEDFCAGGPDLSQPSVETVFRIPKSSANAYAALRDPEKNHEQNLIKTIIS